MGTPIETKYKELVEFFPTEDGTTFSDFANKMDLLEQVIDQINTIYGETLYSQKTTTLIDASKASADRLVNTLSEKYIANTLEAKVLMPIPDLDEVASWVSEIHRDITLQLFDEEFADEVITPALEDIKKAILAVIEDAAEEGIIGKEEEGENE